MRRPPARLAHLFIGRRQSAKLSPGCRISTAEIYPQVNAMLAATGSVVTATDRIGDTIGRAEELSLSVIHAVVKQRSANDETNLSSHDEAAVAT